MADSRPTWYPGTFVRSWPCPRLSFIVPTGAAPQSVRTTFRTVPLARFTLLTCTSSVKGFAGSPDWSTVALPVGTAPLIAGPDRVVAHLTTPEERNTGATK